MSEANIYHGLKTILVNWEFMEEDSYSGLTSTVINGIEHYYYFTYNADPIINVQKMYYLAQRRCSETNIRLFSGHSHFFLDKLSICYIYIYTPKYNLSPSQILLISYNSFCRVEESWSLFHQLWHAHWYHPCSAFVEQLWWLDFLYVHFNITSSNKIQQPPWPPGSCSLSNCSSVTFSELQVWEYCIDVLIGTGIHNVSFWLVEDFCSRHCPSTMMIISLRKIIIDILRNDILSNMRILADEINCISFLWNRLHIW